jgi:hypothetical protein
MLKLAFFDCLFLLANLISGSPLYRRRSYEESHRPQYDDHGFDRLRGSELDGMRA